MTTAEDIQDKPRSLGPASYDLRATELSGLLGPEYLRQSCAEIHGIPRNWTESWSILHATLDGLEATGMTPYGAVMGLLHIEMIREQDLALNLSSLAHLDDSIGTNYVPTASERTTIQEFCAAGAQKISKVTEEIVIDRYRLISSNGRRVALHERVDPYLALISPMRALPPEILQEIFMACLPGDHNAIMHSSEAPLLLSRVCSAWRAISLSTAALWASVHVVVPHITRPYPIPDEDLLPDDNIMQRSEGLQIWLQRSGDCPLSISLFNGSGWGRISRPFLDTVILYSRRLQALTLSQVAGQDMGSLCSLGPDDLPLLEAIDIVDDASWGGPTGSHSAYINLYAIPPNLRMFSLQRVSGQPLPACSWQHITDLRLESQMSFYTLNVEQTVDLLEQCVNLQSCRLAFPTTRDVSAASSESTGVPRRVTFPHLRTLSIRAASAVDSLFNLACILYIFVVPAVEQLTLWSLQVADTPALDEPPVLSDLMTALDQLVERSSCSLRSLYLNQPMGDIESLHRCLRRSTGLTNLVIVDHLSHPSELLPILSELTVLPTSLTSPIPPLCPSLTTLRLVNVDASDAYHPALQTLIESRCGTPPPQVTRLRTMEVVLALSSNLQATVEPARFLPCQVYISEPYDYCPEDSGRARWGGIQSGNQWGHLEN